MKMSLSWLRQYVDFDTHGMFVCTLTEAKNRNNVPTMTYTYYQENVKPKPQTEAMLFI